MFRPPFERRSLAIHLAAIVMARGLAAQGAPPPPPDTVPLPSAGQPAYLSSLRQIAEPVLVAQRPYRVLLAPAATAAALDAADAPDAMARACSNRAAASAPPGYTPGEVAVDASKYFVLIAMAAASQRAECEESWNTSSFAIWSGLSFASRGATRAPAARAVRLVANGVPVEPVLSVARPGVEWNGTSWQPGSAQLRYYYPMGVLASSAAGKRPDLVVQVWDARGRSTSFELSAADGERMQYAYAVWRLAVSGSPARTVRLSPRHPVAAAVREALDLAATNADSGALRAAELLGRAAPTNLTAYDRDVATMLVAETLGHRRDSAAVRALVSNVQKRRFCLTSPAGASASLVATVAASHTRACPEHNPLATLGAGIVVPGGGHWMHGSRLVAGVATVGLSSILVTSFVQDAGARSTFARYEGSRLPKEASDLYELANSQRASARRLAQVGIAIALSDAVIASFITAAMNREVSRGRL